MSAFLALWSQSSTAPTAVILVDPASISSVTESPNGQATVIITSSGARYITPHTFEQIVLACATASKTTLAVAVSVQTGQLLNSAAHFAAERAAAAGTQP